MNVAMSQSVMLTSVDKADYGAVEASVNQILLVSKRSDQQKKYGAYLMIFDDNSKITFVKSS